METSRLRADYLVSVAARPTLEVWRATAVMLARNVPAETYEVIVPAGDVELFREVTPEGISVLSEEGFISDFAKPLKQKLGPGNNRYGWYLQQFIKLEAIRRHADCDRVVIWDADTVPLRPLGLFDVHGTPVFYPGKEHHQPYFDAIRTLLGLEKVVDFSFVAQCIPLTGKWAASFFAEIETKHGIPWWQAILDNFEANEGSGFSEYETLGTFVHHHFGPVTVKPQGLWSRNGYHHVASPSDLLNTDISQKEPMRGFDYIAFEDWNRSKRTKKKKSVLQRLFRRG